MTPYRKRMNPFIQRMVEDMQLRNLAPATIDAYTYHVRLQPGRLWATFPV